MLQPEADRESPEMRIDIKAVHASNRLHTVTKEVAIRVIFQVTAMREKVDARVPVRNSV